MHMCVCLREYDFVYVYAYMYTLCACMYIRASGGIEGATALIRVRSDG